MYYSKQMGTKYVHGTYKVISEIETTLQDYITHFIKILFRDLQ